MLMCQEHIGASATSVPRESWAIVEKWRLSLVWRRWLVDRVAERIADTHVPAIKDRVKDNSLTLGRGWRLLLSGSFERRGNLEPSLL